MKKIEQLFGEAVRRRRVKLGLSQEGFAAKAEIHRTYVSAIELGKVAISISIAQKLAAALGLPLSKLIQDAERTQ
jgi:transcriptional regulator with XRE-family HTH domain